MAVHHSPHTHKKKYNLRDALHCVHSSGIGGRHWQSRDEGAATHAHIERGISRNDAVVAVAEGDRELLQRALHKLRLAHSPAGAGQDGQLIQQLAGWLAHAPVGLMRQGYHPVHS